MNMPMACEESAVRSFRAALVSAIRAGRIQEFENKIAEDTITVKAFNINEARGQVNVVDEYELDDMDLQDNSVALIYVEGMIYPWNAFTLENEIALINANPKLIGAVLLMNTPGGYVHRVDITSDAIANSVKPIASYVTGMCCSAGMYMISGSKRIFCASQGDKVGSIGTMTTYQNDKKFWELMGITEEDIYATLSTEKNDESRKAEDGDFTPIIANLDFINNLFITNISTNLGIPFDETNNVFRGATFFSAEAISKGLVHEIGSLETALNWVLKEGLKVKANNNN